MKCHKTRKTDKTFVWQEKSPTGSFSPSRFVGLATEPGWVTLQVAERESFGSFEGFVTKRKETWLYLI